MGGYNLLPIDEVFEAQTVRIINELAQSDNRLRAGRRSQLMATVHSPFEDLAVEMRDHHAVGPRRAPLDQGDDNR